MCAAVAQSSSPITPGTEGYVYGWGTVDDEDRASATQLRGLDIVTLPCAPFDESMTGGNFVHVTRVWKKSQAPMFICSVPGSNVGLCDGDSGGKPMELEPL